MELDQDLEHLAYIDESENERYDSKAVFSKVGLGVEVEEYEDFTLYTWEDDVEFEDVLESVEKYFPFVEDPALEMLVEKDEALRYKSDRDHSEMSNDFVYDPVRDWRAEKNEDHENRWKPYELIQINLSNAKVVWDDKNSSNRIRIYELEDGLDVFEKVFSEIVESYSDDIVHDVELFK